MTDQTDQIPPHLALIAGRGAYPLELAASARRQGVARITVVAFRGETRPGLRALADDWHTVRVGALGRLVEVLRASGARDAVMAGQISPTSLFRARIDRPMRELLAGLKERNAQTIFGAVGERLARDGIRLLPAHRFMEAAMPAAGTLGALRPTPAQDADIALGFRVAKTTSGLEIGQTVVVKEGTILAVEAFEGTDAAIRRAGRLGGPGAVVVKTARRGHDMRFDIPVVGLRTMRSLRRAGAAALAVEAGRCILLERDKVIAQADRQRLALVALPPAEA